MQELPSCIYARVCARRTQSIIMHGWRHRGGVRWRHRCCFWARACVKTSGHSPRMEGDVKSTPRTETGLRQCYVMPAVRCAYIRLAGRVVGGKPSLSTTSITTTHHQFIVAMPLPTRQAGGHKVRSLCVYCTDTFDADDFRRLPSTTLASRTRRRSTRARLSTSSSPRPALKARVPPVPTTTRARTRSARTPASRRR